MLPAGRLVKACELMGLESAASFPDLVVLDPLEVRVAFP